MSQPMYYNIIIISTQSRFGTRGSILLTFYFRITKKGQNIDLYENENSYLYLVSNLSYLTLFSLLYAIFEIRFSKVPLRSKPNQGSSKFVRGSNAHI